MVGLPARGKTYIAKKLTRYLNWIGITTRGKKNFIVIYFLVNVSAILFAFKIVLIVKSIHLFKIYS